MKKKQESNLNLSDYSSRFAQGLQFKRALWNIVWLLLFRPSPRPFHAWRRMLLRLFGARVGSRAPVHPDVRIWAPWNLILGTGSCLGPGVDCYCVDKIEIGDWTVISQRAFLCAATHDIRSAQFGLRTAPIVIGSNAWVAAEAFIGPGVKIGEGGVIGARACVTQSVKPWSVMAGNPAREISKRIIKKS